MLPSSSYIRTPPFPEDGLAGTSGLGDCDVATGRAERASQNERLRCSGEQARRDAKATGLRRHEQASLGRRGRLCLGRGRGGERGGDFGQACDRYCGGYALCDDAADDLLARRRDTRCGEQEEVDLGAAENRGRDWR